ncbi:MAG TPA: carboxypeptidase regulatory-like domain-containing protein [Longimicrobium sp.]|nr:carboxypeptidase regulatory-like domain-containing protein [Longimicrobium sp.]
MILRRLLALPALLLAFATPAAAQVLSGRVLDAADGQPVPQARISVLNAEGRTLGRTMSAENGTFSLQLRVTDPVRLRAERTGYSPTLTQPVQVGIQETLQVDVRMAVQALTVEPLTVIGRIQPKRRASLQLSGFYDREARGLGRFLRREEIERYANADIAQVVDRIPGTTRIGYNIVLDRSSMAAGAIYRSQKGQGAQCLPQVYLDGNRMAYDRSGLAGMALPEHLEAVEVFSGSSQIPPQYSGSDSACGVILLHTRKEP